MASGRVKTRIREFLYGYRLRTVDLASLQALFSGGADYRVFAAAVRQLEEEGALVPVKARGRNNKMPPLANRYRLGQAAIHHAYFETLKRIRLRLHPLIGLDYYYKAGQKRWERDRPWLERLDAFLKEKGPPVDRVPAPERSYQIFGNEKWLDEEGGREVLERAGISEEMLGIVPSPEPLMWALGPATAGAGPRREYRHLIVENKTPFQALLPVLPEQTAFAALIYGRGKVIVSSLPMFCAQTGLPSAARHTFHYFGDLDREGIGIWYSLRNKMAEAGGSGEIEPAMPFYRALLTKPSAARPDCQREYPEALAQFCAYFSETEQALLMSALKDGGYWPQEALTGAETREIWRGYGLFGS